jgi:hypothetical protein
VGATPPLPPKFLEFNCAQLLIKVLCVAIRTITLHRNDSKSLVVVQRLVAFGKREH